MATRQWFSQHKTYDAAADVWFTPYINDDGSVGIVAEHADSTMVFLTLNPSIDGSGGGPDHTPNVFLYQGDTGWAEQDTCIKVMRTDATDRS